MAGTARGGRKAAATNKMRYGANFYEWMAGKLPLGGRKSRGGGFAKPRPGSRGRCRGRNGITPPQSFSI